ncbi:MAG: kelch repeat-containing protein [Polyangiaceae bacterium]
MTSPETTISVLCLALSMLAACGGGTESTASGGAGGEGATSSSGGTGGAGGDGGTALGGGGMGGAGGGDAAIVWLPTDSLGSSRMRHTATLLDDGRVLVAGGENLAGTALATTELFDPATDQWTAGPPLTTPHVNHAAVKLADGRVAIMGSGETSNNGLPTGTGVSDVVDVFDPTTNSITAGPTLLHARGHHQAVRLDDGRVLVAGGTAEGGDNVYAAEALSSDGTTWAEAGTIQIGRSLFGLAKRTSGDVVIAGGLGSGLLNRAEIFDPTNDSWTSLPNMGLPRMYVALGPLASGGVLAVGGIAGNNLFTNTAERLLPDASAWEAAPSLPSSGEEEILGGTGMSLVPLSDGSLLAVGGYGVSFGNYGPGEFSGIYDEDAAAWTRVGKLDLPRGSAAAIQLNDGRVLLIGGLGISNGATTSCSITEDAVL